MAEDFMAQMDEAAKAAKAALEEMVEKASVEGELTARELRDWLATWKNTAGWKRCGKIILEVL